MTDYSDMFYYDVRSPTYVSRKTAWFAGKAGRILMKPANSSVGTLGADGYFTTKVSGRGLKIHRLVMMLHGHDISNKGVDHIDGNKKNNSIENLRISDGKINARNSKMKCSNTSGVTGVYKAKPYIKGCMGERWIAQWVTLEGKQVQRQFSVVKFGNELAYELACKSRTEAIFDLNIQEAGYTERHGT